jgi:copper chaperone CopZ
MKMITKRFIEVILFVGVAWLLPGLHTLSLAAERTVVLKTPACVCGDTVIIARSTLSGLEGVKSVDPNPIAQTATIVYDDTKTNPQVFIDLLQRQGQSVLGKPKFID